LRSKSQIADARLESRFASAKKGGEARSTVALFEFRK